MEGNVWTRNQRFALAVISALSLSTSMNAAQELRNPTSSYDVRASDAASISTSKSTPVKDRNVLRITREAKTSAGTAGRFGVMAYEGKFLCYTLEHENVKIPTGTYRGELRWSERFRETVPYIHVQNRSGIEIHVGNCPQESGGCVLVGTAKDGACLGGSRTAMKDMMAVLPQTFTVIVE